MLKFRGLKSKKSVNKPVNNNRGITIEFFFTSLSLK